MTQRSYWQGLIPGSGRDFSLQHVQTGSGEHTVNSSLDNWRDTILQARWKGAQTLSQLNIVVCRTCILVAVIHRYFFSSPTCIFYMLGIFMHVLTTGVQISPNSQFRILIP